MSQCSANQCSANQCSANQCSVNQCSANQCSVKRSHAIPHAPAPRNGRRGDRSGAPQEYPPRAPSCLRPARLSHSHPCLPWPS
ncbi:MULTISPECIES: hypothetical protein [Cobetia]|uniref:hypothetical protein n=1 Tax=Cobetia TaxID=204286 RepID=UPI0015E197A1